jgi:hypothetical protein
VCHLWRAVGSDKTADPGPPGTRPMLCLGAWGTVLGQRSRHLEASECPGRQWTDCTLEARQNALLPTCERAITARGGLAGTATQLLGAAIQGAG